MHLANSMEEKKFGNQPGPYQKNPDFRFFWSVFPLFVFRVHFGASHCGGGLIFYPTDVDRDTGLVL